MKKIFSMTVYRIDGDICALAVGLNPRSDPAKLALHFTMAIEKLVIADPHIASTILTMLITCVENIKDEHPDIAAEIRRQHIDHIKKENRNEP
jgi:hypothetical protein